ncbi:MAG: Xaa-Pro peptidase family protein [Waddliaceae bacterium]
MDLYQQRLGNLQRLLSELSCDALLIEDNINLFYLTGLDLSAGRLLAHGHGAELIVDSRYYEVCKQTSPFPVHLAGTNGAVASLLSSPPFDWVETLGFAIENTTYERFLQLKGEVDSMNKGGKRGHSLTLMPVENPAAALRRIKDAAEIQTLREAAQLGSRGFDYVCSLLQEGMAESEIALELEIYWKREGGKSLAFDPIIAFGANSSMPHYRAGDRQLQMGDTVQIDIGVNHKHYHSDMSRVVFFGDPDPKMLAIYDIVLSAQEAALNLCRPGTLIGDLDDSARSVIVSEGYGENFTHSLGHGLGLEVHEPPIIRNRPPYRNLPLEAGMVLTIEPGIYLPGVGGVRLEDTVVITEEGCENLTKRPK